jgi:hypothetical protein
LSVPQCEIRKSIEDTSKAIALAEDAEKMVSENRRVERVSANEFGFSLGQAPALGSPRFSRLGCLQTLVEPLSSLPAALNWTLRRSEVFSNTIRK